MWALLLMVTGLGATVLTSLATCILMMSHGRSMGYASIVALLLMLPQLVGISLGIVYLEDKERERKTK